MFQIAVLATSFLSSVAFLVASITASNKCDALRNSEVLTAIEYDNKKLKSLLSTTRKWVILSIISLFSALFLFIFSLNSLVKVISNFERIF